MSTKYTSLSEVNGLQKVIMQFVDLWVHEKNTPIPLKEIIDYMEKQDVKDFTVRFAINTLLRSGYLRRVNGGQNTRCFTQLRKV